MQLNQAREAMNRSSSSASPAAFVFLYLTSTLTLAGSSGIKGPVKLKKNGTFNCSTPDLNNDGLPDLVCHFDDNGLPSAMWRGRGRPDTSRIC